MRVDLTDRQEQVLKLVVEGATNDEIGAEIGIKGGTAKAHVDVLRRKFGVERKRELIRAGRDWLGVAA